MPKISIIIPVYNVEAFLDKCFGSIMAQDFTDFEVIVINDGSKDGSGAICDQWAQKYPQIRVTHKPNEGVAAARNLGMEQASGDYIYFIDPDDWIEPDTLSENYALAQSGDFDMVVFGYQKETVTASGIQVSQSRLKQVTLHNKSEMAAGLVPLLESGGRFSIWNKLIKASVIRSHTIVFPNFKRGQDIAFMLEVMANTTTLVSNPKIHYHQYAFVSVEKYNPDAVEHHAHFLKRFWGLYDGWMDNPVNYNYFVKLLVLWYFHVIPSSIAANPRLRWSEKRAAFGAIFSQPEVSAYLDAISLSTVRNRSVKWSLALVKTKSFLLLYTATRLKLFLINKMNTSLFRKLYNR